MKQTKNVIKFFICILLIIAGMFLIVLFFPIKIRTSEYEARLSIGGVYLDRYLGEEKDVVVPNYIGFFPVTAIERDCFSKKEFIETVAISENVKYIGVGAFSNCYKLKSIKGTNVKTVDNLAFFDDRNLEEVDLGNHLQFLWKQAFYGCNKLSYIPSKESLTKIDDNAFEGCDIKDIGDLKGITVGKDVFKDNPWSIEHNESKDNTENNVEGN